MSDSDAPSGEYRDDDYKLRQGQSGENVPVVGDAGADEGVQGDQDSDAQLGM